MMNIETGYWQYYRCSNFCGYDACYQSTVANGRRKKNEGNKETEEEKHPWIFLIVVILLVRLWMGIQGTN